MEAAVRAEEAADRSTLATTMRTLEARLSQERFALRCICAKLQKAETHPPLRPEQAHAKHVKLPRDYDYGEELFRWANDRLGTLRDERDELLRSIPVTERLLNDARTKLLATLPAILASQQRHPIPQPPESRKVKRAPSSRRIDAHAEAEMHWWGRHADTLISARLAAETPMPIRRDRLHLAFDPTPEPSYTGVQPIDQHVIMVGAFPG